MLRLQRRGGSLLFQDSETVKYSNLIKSCSTNQVAKETRNSQDIAASPVSGSLVCFVCSVIHQWVLGLQKILNRIITLGADPESFQTRGPQALTVT